MTRGQWLGFFLLGALVYSLISVFQSAPGYMDADYYAVTGARLSGGLGFSEPFIWNYLNKPAGIPTPSHLYWMPFASIIAAVGSCLGRSMEFMGMKIPFVLMAAFIVPVTVWIAHEFIKERRFAWISGIAASFAGLYWVYMTLPETFGVYMLAGAGLIALVGSAPWLRISKWQGLGLSLLAGILAGIMHLTRADGLLWLAGSLIWVIITSVFAQKGQRKPSKFRIVMICTVMIFGYLAVMAPWYIRNLSLFGRLMPPGNSSTLWLTSYDQTYNYPASDLTFANWAASGLGAILLSRWQALKLNLANLVVVQAGIAFLPLIVPGIWRFRKDNRVLFLLFMWLITFIVMTFIFPFAGARGGYLHSGAAFQLFLWALIPVGLESLLEWGNRKRGWSVRQAFTVFGAGLSVVAVGLSGFFFVSRVIGSDASQTAWGKSERSYQMIGAGLSELGVTENEVGAVNNPPGYYWATGRPSIVIPNGDIDHLLQAAQTYHASYLVLENNQANLQSFYENPGDRAGLDYLGSIGDTQIYRILANE